MPLDGLQSLRCSALDRQASVLAFMSRRPFATTKSLAPMSANTAIYMVGTLKMASPLISSPACPSLQSGFGLQICAGAGQRTCTFRALYAFIAKPESAISRTAT